ncbi:transcription factor TFIIIB component B'' homolog [Oppia nitens]|uniref:transcription factor TFIIIB component B'' homolog n=1 Tax=Oppia nitens TaxID=1686743 RepID=UPI0023DC3869|nr:transcription factor TFIIIB component B'' homolog [Oppia nitens]
MSTRRTKMQFKPKVANRTVSVANKSPQKVTTDCIDKSNDLVAEEPAKELQIDSQVKTVLTHTYNTLTTKIIRVLDEDIETKDDNKDNSVELLDTIDQISDINDNNNKQVTDSVVVEEITQNVTKELPIETEANKCETDDKLQKQIHQEIDDNNNKSVVKAIKETNRKRKTSRKRNKCDKKDKSMMTMKDLLLYNPPMTEQQKEMRDKDTDVTETQTNVECDENNDTKEDNNESDETNAGPRVKVGADGQLILDEESVILKRKRRDTSDTVIEKGGTTSAFVNYSSFRNKNKSSKPRWTEHETIRFYSALNTIGTDFTLMSNLFFKDKRSRLDLRNKFKKEEKINKAMIDEALFSPNTFINQCSQLDELLNESSSDSDIEDNNESNKQSIANT